MDAPRRCPRCGSDEVIRILYGTPSPELLEEARAGRVALGAVMCFGPKHRSGCALHVSTSGANKRRNRDLSRKPNHTLGTSQESRLFALRQSGAGISRVEGGSFVLARCEQKFAATNVCSTLAPEQPCPETTPGGRLGRGLEKPKSHFSQHLHAPQRDGVEWASSP